MFGQHGGGLLLFRQHCSIHRRADGGSGRRERGHEAPILGEKQRGRKKGLVQSCVLLFHSSSFNGACTSQGQKWKKVGLLVLYLVCDMWVWLKSEKRVAGPPRGLLRLSPSKPLNRSNSLKRYNLSNPADKENLCIETLLSYRLF